MKNNDIMFVWPMYSTYSYMCHMQTASTTLLYPSHEKYTFPLTSHQLDKSMCEKLTEMKASCYVRSFETRTCK